MTACVSKLFWCTIGVLNTRSTMCSASAKPAATIHVNSKWLDRADDNVSAVLPGRFDDTKRNRVHGDDGFRTVLPRRIANLFRLKLDLSQV